MLNQVQRATLSQKLILVMALLAVPIAVLLYSLVGEQNRGIAFAQQELVGVEYLRSVREAADAMRRRMATSQGGANDVSDKLNAVELADKKLGPVLNPKGASRTTSQLLSSMRQKWNDFESAAPADRIAAAAVDDALQALISHVGDTSNLILDPDLDSYYVMDAVVLKIPALQSQIRLTLDRGRSSGGKALTRRRTE